MDYDCVCDYEQPSVFRKSNPVAKKQHRCTECGSYINTGTKYEYVWGIWEGHVSTFKVCQHCAALRDYTVAHVPCFCWAYGNIREDALETLENYAHESPGLWFGGARHYVRARKISRQQAIDKQS